ncbi:GH16030 [Drosophila grimshawi]|uniref:GH16030 n=1 Tax=Drosophila grimshawi TaxID=7222 RepID=B4J2R1_DROGR|nr:GH16030 [Drosophila grimshawi]
MVSETKCAFKSGPKPKLSRQTQQREASGHCCRQRQANKPPIRPHWGFGYKARTTPAANIDDNNNNYNNYNNDDDYFDIRRCLSHDN